MKTNAEMIFDLGIPRLRETLAAAQKALGLATSRGVPEEDARAVLCAMAHAADPTAAVPAGAEDLYGDVARAMTAARAGRTFFVERAAPALWRSWAGDAVEEGAIRQMENACRLPVAAGGALMPDAHQGYGLPIGGVLAVRNAVIPYAVGVDIACRMRLTVFAETPGLIDDASDRLAEALESETRFGVGAAFARGEQRRHPVMDEDWSVSPVTAAHYSKAREQLGTSGCGNHFVEFGTLTVTEAVDEPGFKLSPGVYLALLSHSGSRGTGEAVATHYSKLAQSLHPELPDDLKHLAWLELGTPEGDGYWAAMELMGRYAAANHRLIHEAVTAHLGLTPIGAVENHHNFAWKEAFDGEELVIHRKGATPAGEGVLGVVPGSMGTPGFVVRGKGNPASYASCSHGAGRLMSRKQAFATLSEARMREILEERRVRLLSGPLDESPEVYKNIEDVIAAQADLIDVLARFDPRIVKMAPAKEAQPAWRRKKRSA